MPESGIELPARKYATGAACPDDFEVRDCLAWSVRRAEALVDHARECPRTDRGLDDREHQAAATAAEVEIGRWCAIYRVWQPGLSLEQCHNIPVVFARGNTQAMYSAERWGSRGKRIHARAWVSAVIDSAVSRGRLRRPGLLGAGQHGLALLQLRSKLIQREMFWRSAYRRASGRTAFPDHRPQSHATRLLDWS